MIRMLAHRLDDRRFLRLQERVEPSESETRDNWEQYEALLERHRIERPRITEKPTRRLRLAF